MTIKKAISQLKSTLLGFANEDSGNNIVICRLEPETCRIAIEALEKQIPKKPDMSGDSCDKDGNLIYDTYDCPNCHTSYETEYEKYDYCPSCGQALDWSEEVNKMNDSENKILLEKLNKFTRRELSADEVYIFPIILCDNDIDRDNERFSRAALETLAEKFIGVTGILDHDPKGRNQIARIFATEVVEEDRLTEAGEPYAYLKGYAYMVRTDKNADLICEIDGGIKKEVSIACAANRQICSVCGTDKHTNACCHIKGCTYDDKRCFITLEDIFDVYEWSFVVPPITHSKGIKMPVKPVTNYEKIKSMSIEEMTDFIYGITDIFDDGGFYGMVIGGTKILDCFPSDIKKWLESGGERK